ncbi:MAG: competence/damage-inducible protein A, partial [Candidatus Binatia bacterium]
NRLTELGAGVRRILTVADDADAIRSALKESIEVSDLVILTGGLGPTHDDMTIAGVAKAFSVEVVVDPQLRAVIEKVGRGEPSASFLKMAEVPRGAQLVAGGHRHFPTVVIENVYVLPGIPEIFEAKVAGLRERFRTAPFHLRQVLVSADETVIADYLNATLDAFPDLLLGSYPKLANPHYRVRLTLESKDESYLERALDDLVARMPASYIVKIERGGEEDEKTTT